MTPIEAFKKILDGYGTDDCDDSILSMKECSEEGDLVLRALESRDELLEVAEVLEAIWPPTNFHEIVQLRTAICKAKGEPIKFTKRPLR
jgi:hypothetical protein